jgi:hypothetical protein
MRTDPKILARYSEPSKKLSNPNRTAVLHVLRIGYKISNLDGSYLSRFCEKNYRYFLALSLTDE